MCVGYELSVPDGQNTFSIYPIALHTVQSVPWNVTTRGCQFFLYAIGCRGEVTMEGSTCTVCSHLSDNTLLKGIIQRFTAGVSENAPYHWHGAGQLMTMLRLKARTIDEGRLRQLNSAKRLINLERVLDAQKQTLMAIASNRIPAINRVLSAAFRRGSSIYQVLQQVDNAAQGVYHPRGYEDEDYLRGLLFLRLGGARVADMAHRTMDTPATSTLRKHTTLPQLQASPGVPTAEEVTHNLDASLSGMHDALGSLTGSGVGHAVLMFDELAVERRLRWCDRTNSILGVARESSAQAGLQFNTMADVDCLLGEIERGEVDMAVEATVGAIGFLGSHDTAVYSARPFLLSGSSKRETAEAHATILQTSLSAVRSNTHCRRIRIVSLASDGEARRGRALVLLTFKTRLAESSPIFPLLAPLRLMDLHVGNDDITADKDAKHIFKNARSAIFRKKGVTVKGVWLKKGTVRAHLEDVGHSQEHLDTLFNVADKQDVAVAYQLLRDIWKLPPASPEAYLPSYCETRDALRIFGQLFRHLILPYTCIDLSLSEQLTHLSAAAHLAMALFSFPDAGGNFLPVQLYVNIMLMIKNVFFTVAKAKIDCPLAPFYLVLLGTDRLETLFGILRTMVGSDANLDLLQLILRVTATVEVSNIFSRYPHWDRTPRRLHLPILSRDEVPVQNVDHIGPRSFRGDLKPANVTLLTCWKAGRRQIEDTDATLSERLAAIDSTVESSILAPNGTLLIHLPAATDAGIDTDDAEECEYSVGQPTQPVPTGGDSNCDGLCELEDAAADAQWRLSVNSSSAMRVAVPQFSNMVDIDGKGTLVRKSRALAARFEHKKSARSTDRLRRIAGEEKYAPKLTSVSQRLLDGNGNRELLSIGNPVASLFRWNEKLFLGLAQVNDIQFNSQPCDEFPTELLGEDSAKLSLQLIGLRPATVEDDPSQRYDWRSAPLLSIHLSDVAGRVITPVDPKLVIPGLEQQFFLLDTPTLISLTSSLHDKLVPHHVHHIASVSPRAFDFPYKEPAGTSFSILMMFYE
ncbi:hypothetical protein CONPUDRAFT_61354 [Coniophora puteana RWD-64-598 SS2]|uniref:Uncharacterized protein n=1 Tax=Coniophora puteana (strain RWD-64-598) TaxID=741705 RepID=A0A5M3MGQ1_CONPW|nr:uncharacterized protein CONPUDRAFT_61354 [Coniophora puteana RWD-64-598 SS2]EIW77944.1 hypothetical protein CONPUDRAFT_61354 [Coniophora puteana RWD-64-598 SS2]